MNIDRYDLNWHTDFGLATDLQLDRFELDHGFKFSSEHRQFLTAVTNGCHVDTDLAIPTQGCYGEACALHGIYGVNLPSESLDMSGILDIFQEHLPFLVPFGYDQGSGQVFVEMKTHPGTLVYVPWDELGERPLPTYFVANSLGEFFEAARQLAKIRKETE